MAIHTISMCPICNSHYLFRIGYAIAKHLANNGAKIVVSSRKQANVDMAVKEMKKENVIVHGLVCNVGKKEDRTRLIEEVITWLRMHTHISSIRIKICTQTHIFTYKNYARTHTYNLRRRINVEP